MQFTGETYQQAHQAMVRCGEGQQVVLDAQLSDQERVESALLHRLLYGARSQWPIGAVPVLPLYIQAVRPSTNGLRVIVPFGEVWAFGAALAMRSTSDSIPPADDIVIRHESGGPVTLTAGEATVSNVEVQCPWRELRTAVEADPLVSTISAASLRLTANAELVVPPVVHELLSGFLRRIALFDEPDALDWLFAWHEWAVRGQHGSGPLVPPELFADLTDRSFGLRPVLHRNFRRKTPKNGLARALESHQHTSNVMDGHVSICTVDIADYGGMDRTRTNYVALRNGMYSSVRQAFAESGIPWDESFRQDRGDGILALVPAGVPKGLFTGPLPDALSAALCAYNEGRPPEEQVRLRLALHAGEVRFDKRGDVASQAIIHAFRLLDAPPLKNAMADGATLAMIASDWFYTEVIRRDATFEPQSFTPVEVVVKETNTIGWMRVPDREALESPTLPPAAPVVDGVPIVAPILPSPSSSGFFDVVAALEEIPCMQAEQPRSLVLEQLPFSGAVRYFPARRPHVISMLRTCLDFENGVVQLLVAIAQFEPAGSIPLKRLLSLLIDGV
jgi:Effector-associated domain 2